MLEWARKNNCPWSGDTTLYAALNNHLVILRWARQQQPSCPWWSLNELADWVKAEFTHAKPSTLLWLAQQGAPLPDEAHAIACSFADRLTHAYMALQASLPAGVLTYILTLSIE